MQKNIIGIGVGIVYLACGVMCQFWYANDTNKVAKFRCVFYFFLNFFFPSIVRMCAIFGKKKTKTKK